MAKLSEIFGRIIGDTSTGEQVADYLTKNPYANAKDLTKFQGIGMTTATTLLMVMESSSEYLAGTKADTASSPEHIAMFLSWMKWEQQENMVLVTLDASNHIIGKHVISKGIVNQTIAHPREIFRHAILDNAVSIILAHNHPSGNTNPSKDDIHLTEEIIKAGCIMKIPCLDHIVLSRSGYTSIRRNNPEIFN